jgi:hypothetical protein
MMEIRIADRSCEVTRLEYSDIRVEASNDVLTLDFNPYERDVAAILREIADLIDSGDYLERMADTK